jgi:hypothetical protein
VAQAVFGAALAAGLRAQPVVQKRVAQVGQLALQVFAL